MRTCVRDVDHSSRDSSKLVKFRPDPDLQYYFWFDQGLLSGDHPFYTPLSLSTQVDLGSSDLEVVDFEIG